MSINMNNDYEQFYKGTEQLKNYGSDEKGKKKLVRYEFNTTDEKGNKVMDKMSREETLQAMKDIRSQYGDDVIVEFSGDGMAKLIEGRKGHLDRPLSAEEAARKAERQAAFDGAVVKMENTHRVAVSDTQANDNKDGGKYGAKFLELQKRLASVSNVTNFEGLRKKTDMEN